MGDKRTDIEANIRGLKDDLFELTRDSYLKRYRKALKDAISAVKALPPTATDQEIIDAGTVTVPDPGGL